MASISTRIPVTANGISSYAAQTAYPESWDGMAEVESLCLHRLEFHEYGLFE